MTSAFLTRHGVSVVGNPHSSRWLIFVHGFGTDQTAWSALVPAFSDRFRIVLFNNAGAKGTDPEAFVQHRYLSLKGYVADLIAITEEVGARDALLVGHSVGATVGMLGAVARPDLYSKLVLIGASPRYLDEPGYHGGFAEADLQAIYTAIASGYGEWADSYAAMTMAPHRPDLAQHFAASLKSIPPDHALTVLCSIFQSDHRAEAALVTQPTLIVQTHDDVAVPLEVARFLHDAIKASRLEVIDAVGHLPHISAPARVIETIESFLQQLQAS